MKYLYVIIFIALNLVCSVAAAGELSAEAKALSNKCNLEARNALINGDLELVENVCTQAMKTIGSTGKNRKYQINPMLNLAYSYSLSGQFEKAAPLYDRARLIGAEFYEPGNRILRDIDQLIEVHEKMKKQRAAE